jgi:uncharacterized membrane protein
MSRTVLGVVLLAVGVLLVAAGVFIVASGPTEGVGWPLVIAYGGGVVLLGFVFVATGIRWARPR